MKNLTPDQPSAQVTTDWESNRRRHARVWGHYGLMYSGFDGAEVLLGDGMVVDLSRGGLGIKGNQPVKVGMELTLFLYLPHGEDPLFVMEARVAWVSGRKFGVEFERMNLRELNRLSALLVTRLTH